MYVCGVFRMNKHTDELLEALDIIANLIYYQADIAEQDKWLETIMDRNIWKPSMDRNIWSKECCKNGCEKCEQ